MPKKWREASRPTHEAIEFVAVCAASCMCCSRGERVTNSSPYALGTIRRKAVQDNLHQHVKSCREKKSWRDVKSCRETPARWLSTKSYDCARSNPRWASERGSEHKFFFPDEQLCSGVTTTATSKDREWKAYHMSCTGMWMRLASMAPRGLRSFER